jgi:mono/diheme cytochrome c family protein
MHRIGRGYLAPGARDAIGERRKGVQRRDTDLQCKSGFKAIRGVDQLNPSVRFLFGVFLGFLIVPAALFFYVLTGHAPVASADPSMPMEAFFAKMGRKARIRSEQPKRDLSTFNSADLEAGADIYQRDCAFCHGLPNQPKPDAAKGMFPKAPQLFDHDDMVTDDPVGEDYWKVKNGIRLSGMPGFKDSLADTQIWQVSALVARAGQLPPEASAKLKPRSE